MILVRLASNQIFPINVSSSAVDPARLKSANGSLPFRQLHTSGLDWPNWPAVVETERRKKKKKKGEEEKMREIERKGEGRGTIREVSDLKSTSEPKNAADSILYRLTPFSRIGYNIRASSHANV